jgi:integrase
VGEAADRYAEAFNARAHLAATTKRNANHYVSKAIRLMGGGTVALAAIDARSVRLMLDVIGGSAFERHHVFGAFNRFMDWCVKRELIDANPCGRVDREDRPRPGRSRDHTPPIATIRRAWDAVEDAPDHVRALIRFLLLVPLRREEAQGLLWSEVRLGEKRIDILAERTRARRPHSLPLSEPALAILSERALCPGANDRVFAPPSGAKTINWGFWVTRVRLALDEDHLDRARRFNLHDLRRSFVSHLAERGLDLDLLDQCLSHSRKGVFGVYQRATRWREKESAMAAWAKLVAPSGARDNVVPIRARDKLGSRGQSGSSSDQDGLGIPSRSAPASSRDILTDHLGFAFGTFKDNENEGWLLNMALQAVEGGAKAWRAETRLERPPGPSLGRPKVVDKDVQKLLEMRAAEPGSDCRTAFEKWTCAGKQAARIRYQKADAMAAELIASMLSSSGKPSRT